MERDSKKPIRFHGLSLSIDEYDDDLVEREYLFHNYQNLLTALEVRLCIYLSPIVSESEHRGIRKMYPDLEASQVPIEEYRKIHELHAYLEERDGHVPEHETLAAAQIPKEEYRANVVKRLIAECHDQIDFNRCTECDRLPRSPLAKQCPWCGYDWH